MRRWAVLGLVVLCGCQPGHGLLTSSPPPEERGEPLDCGLPEEGAAVEIYLPEEDTSTDALAQEAQGEPATQTPPEPKPATKEYQDTSKEQNSTLPEGGIEKQSRRVAVSGRTFHAAAIKVPLGSFRLRLGLAQGRVGATEALADIARRHNAVAAINGCFFDAYSDRTVRNPYGHLATGGQVIHISDHPTTLGTWADGSAAIGQVKYKVKGSLDGKETWPGNWYAYGINDYPLSENLAQLYTPRWALGDTPGDGIQVVIRNGKVTEKRAGSHAIPNDGYIVYLRGKEKYLADRFKVGQECAYRVAAEGTAGERDWSKVTEALGCGPLLVKAGEVALDAASEGFRDPKVLSNAGQRSAVGLTSDGYLYLVTCSGATMKQLAYVMKGIGCESAMNLDGGASSALYYEGRYLTSPGRDISNALLVVPE